jgi:hypothetical protein
MARPWKWRAGKRSPLAFHRALERAVERVGIAGAVGDVVYFVA